MIWTLKKRESSVWGKSERRNNNNNIYVKRGNCGREKFLRKRERVLWVFNAEEKRSSYPFHMMKKEGEVEGEREREKEREDIIMAVCE